jgi:hypothetical protein
MNVKDLTAREVKIPAADTTLIVNSIVYTFLLLKKKSQDLYDGLNGRIIEGSHILLGNKVFDESVSCLYIYD